MSCQLIETRLNDGKSRYVGSVCKRVFALRSGLSPQTRHMCVVKPVDPQPGVGTELMLLLKEIGVEASPNCPCHERARQMNAWGIAGCEENRATIIEWLKESASTLAWLDRAKIAFQAARAPWLSIAKPCDSLLGEAIRRAQASTPPT